MSTVVCGPRKSPRLNKQQVKNPQVRNSNVIKNSTEVTSHRRSTPMTNQQDLSNATVNLNSATVRRRLDLLNPPDEHEATDENEILDLPLPPPPLLTEFDKKTCININNLPEYERLKILSVMQNNEVYKAMKLPTLAIGVRNEFRKCKVKEKMQQESEEYIPPEHEEQSENETVKTPKKRTKKVEKTKLNIGPTTRSRANILVEKDVRNSVPAEPEPECAIQLPRNEGIGTMAAYLLLRDNQKKNVGNGSASGSGTAKGKAVEENDLPDIENEVVDEGRKYKTDTAVMNYRLEKIEKAMAAPGGSSGIDELISDGKSHGPSWLIGRHAESAKVSTTTAPRSTYVQELTAQIKQNLVDEMEAKVNKKIGSAL
ncbi:hypothetical protein POM88_047077 [Heracleum sosnowskyi]|uniref:Uncharacterized protein n=1 Tax=Heracleum sosnowskyi TaxID=360622 RepID=A0AAD8H9V3_9APIA|nr:hypothetical protein POM88_047077 [Heracleum sosnowskyi]